MFGLVLPLAQEPFFLPVDHPPQPPQLYLQLSVLSSSWALRREAEVDRVLSVLSRIRDLKDTSSKLDMAVRRQNRLHLEELRAKEDAVRKAELRAAKAAILAGLKHDMQAAISRCVFGSGYGGPIFQGMGPTARSHDIYIQAS